MWLVGLHVYWCDVGGIGRRGIGVVTRLGPDGFRRPGVWPFVRGDLSGGGSSTAVSTNAGATGPRDGSGRDSRCLYPLCRILDGSRAQCACLPVCLVPREGVRRVVASALGDVVENFFFFQIWQPIFLCYIEF